MALSATPLMADATRQRSPRFFALMAPGWALYMLLVFVLTALAGIAGWMMQNGLRRGWALLSALGVGVQVGGFALLWQRHAWHNRLLRELAPISHAQQVAQIDRHVRRTARGCLWIGAALLTCGIIGAVRDRKLPTLP